MIFIGEYHQEKVLSLPESQRRQMDLPNFREDAEILNEIFGWVIKCGKEKIECRSEDEAKYILALWGFNWNDFWIPVDEKYLSEILTRLLKLAKRHKEIIDERCSLYSSRKVQEELRRQIYLTVTLREEQSEEESVEYSEETIEE